MADTMDFPNAGDLVDRYLAGVSLKQLAKEVGTSRTPLLRMLMDRGIPIRGRSDAERLKWSAMKADPAAVTRQCEGAWVARRGSADPMSRRIARAATRYLRLTHRGSDEDALAAHLRHMGFEVEQQFAARNYNLDIAFASDRVAVELLRSNFTHRAASAQRQRMEYLLDRGWCVLVVLNDRRRGVDFSVGAVAQQVIAVVKQARRNKTKRGQYGVIRCDGKPMPRPRGNLDHLPYVFSS